MKLYLTGSSGFIGSNVRRYLQQRHQVYTDKNQVDKDTEAIVHCAIDRENLQHNIEMVKELKALGLPIVNIGSGAEVSDREEYAEYADVKRKITAMCHVTLRVYGCYGANDNSERFIPSNIRRGLAGKPITVDNQAVFDYIFAEDLAHIIETILKKKSVGVFEAVPTVKHTMPEIAKMIAKITDAPSVENSQTKHFPYFGSNKMLLEEIGDFKFTPLEIGLEMTTEYYRNRMEKLK